MVDHARLYSNFRKALRPGGSLVAQCGGDGSLAALRPALARAGVDLAAFNNYPSAADAESSLIAAGFGSVACWLTDERSAFESTSELREFLRGGVLAPYLASLDATVGQRLVEESVAATPDLIVRFVRLNLTATAVP